MQGWECPKCGRCYSPFTAACGVCGPVTITGGSTVWPLPTGEIPCPACGQNRNMPALTGCPIGSHYGITCQLNG